MSDAAIPASTLILVRDRDGAPPDLLMVERSDNMAFAAGALVFPGGRIDDADAALGRSLGLDDGAAVAAVRETIEETAVPVGLSPSLSKVDLTEISTAPCCWTCAGVAVGDAAVAAMQTVSSIKPRTIGPPLSNVLYTTGVSLVSIGRRPYAPSEKHRVPSAGIENHAPAHPGARRPRL